MSMSGDDRVRGQTERRKELNRQAAQKLRNRQKEKAVTAKQDYFKAQSRNTELTYEIKQLRKKKEALRVQLDNHLPTCHKIISRQPAQAFVKQEVTADLSSLIANGSGLTPVFVSNGNSVTVQFINLNNTVNSAANPGLISAVGLGTIDPSAVQAESDVSSSDANSKAQMYGVEPDGVCTTLMMDVEPQSSADDNDANDDVQSDQESIVIDMDNNEPEGDEKDFEEQSEQTENAGTNIVADSGNENAPSEKQTEEETSDCNQGSSAVDNITTIVNNDGVETPKAASPAKLEKVTRSSTKKRRSLDSNSSQDNTVTAKSSEACPLPVTVSLLTADD